MLIRRFFVFVLFGGLLLSTPALSQKAPSPETTLKQFYAWYVDALNKSHGKRPLEAELRKYVTADYLGQAKAMAGADPFLQAQDWDPDWGKNLSVLQSKVVEGGARVEILMTGKVIPKQQLNLALIKEADGWKIDYVQAVTP